MRGCTGTAGQLELLALPAEPVGVADAVTRGCFWTRRLDRLRSGLHSARLGTPGSGALYDDLMAVTTPHALDPRIDPRDCRDGRLFGGYMANWIAGHTDRVDAIVPHASLRALDQSNSTTDAAYYRVREYPRQAAANRGTVRRRHPTPMSSSTATRNRVPIREALRPRYQLLSESGLPAAEMVESPSVPVLPLGEPLVL